ncbi:unnamed protein product [Rotaria socialis]|uniref:Uncharacterized protein n=1 Tax=Rotaria socialis TaxID=392032 RepID=A0A821PAA6_9BILA|nr:unnamed protein product [Rotaria socialis]
MTTTNSTSDVMDQLSPTLALDISMKEIDQNGREDERMVLVFNAFDQIIPQLGVFSPITAKLRNEFFDFIYSGQFTVEKIHNKTPKKRKRIACVERLAFKVLCHRLIDQHHEQSNMFENKIADMETNLAGKNRDLNQAFEKVEQIENAKQKLIDELASLKRTLNEKDNEIQKLKEECDRIRYNSDQEINKTRLQVKEIIENQAATEALIDDLSKYKQGYDEMQEAFTDNSTRAPSAKRRAAQDDNDNDAYVDVKNQIMLDIQVALRLEDQLSTLLNMTTEEYDQILDDEHTKLLQTQQFPSECHFIWDNIAAEKLRYAQTIKEIREEIDITQRHRRSLEEKLEMIVIKENEELKNRKVTAVFTANEAAQKTGKISNPLHGLEHAFESAGRKTDMIGYAPQERIISRFSYMLESSNNGRAWADFELSSFCDSCADKTYLCPHKFAEAQIIARVPDGTKYIRISRPILKYNDTLVRFYFRIKKKEYLILLSSRMQILELFSHILIGNIDLAGIYYVTLLGDILDKIEWNETDDIRVFFNSIYPFLDEEGLDTVVIDFISYTENKISRHLVIEFIITLLLKGKEPLIQEMQYKLSVQLTQNFDMMNELEFHTAIENIAYTADERIVSRFFKRAERHSHWDNLQGFVLMTKLAHIAAFIYFTQLIEEQKEPLNERILKEYNLRRKSDGIDREGRAGKQITHEQMEPIKYFKLKALGQILYEPNITELPDDRKNLNASASFENENISQS